MPPELVKSCFSGGLTGTTTFPFLLACWPLRVGLSAAVGCAGDLTTSTLMGERRWEVLRKDGGE